MKPLRVMVVDDSAITVKKLSKMLESLGHEVVHVAANGQEAADAYPAAKPDLVTMDITMPDMDGIQATRLILARDPAALIVMVTSHGQEQMVIDAIDAGAKGYVLKPVRQDKLGEHLQQVYQKYGAGVPSSPGSPSASDSADRP